MKTARRGIASLLVLPLLLLGCPLDVAAEAAPEEASGPGPGAAAARAAAEKLLSAGLTPAEASARIAAMSPAEIAHAAHPDTEIRRGGDGAAAVLLFLVVVGLFLFFVLEVHHSVHS